MAKIYHLKFLPFFKIHIRVSGQDGKFHSHAPVYGAMHRQASIVRALACGKLRPEQRIIQPSPWTTIENRK
jgi:hypothetical protein